MATSDSSESKSPPQSSDQTGQLGPMDGGRWRPVKPDELLKKNGDADMDANAQSEAPKVQLERRQKQTFLKRPQGRLGPFIGMPQTPCLASLCP